MYRTNIWKPRGEGGGVNRAAGIDVDTYRQTDRQTDILTYLHRLDN